MAPTLAPTVIPQPTPLIPVATHLAEATVAAFKSNCLAPASELGAYASPDGHWIASMCQGDNDKVDSYLHVTGIQGAKDWVIHYANYAHGEGYDRNNLIAPFHWSHDGKYLYAASSSKADGCCWIGDSSLLVRLNLENGQQTEVVHFRASDTGADFSFSPSDRYFLYIPQDGRDNLYIVDLRTWTTRVVRLKFDNTGAGYTVMSNDDAKVVLMLREYPPEIQGDMTFGSILIIDLKNGGQKKLLSGMIYENTPRPIGWKDATHVLLSSDNGFWQLDTNTAELVRTTNP